MKNKNIIEIKGLDMDFKEFAKLVDSILTKEKVDIVPNENNFESFLCVRFLSFYCPDLLILLNKTANKRFFVPYSEKPEKVYEYFYASIPKLPKKYLKYVKRKNIQSEIDNYYENNSIDAERVKDLANYYECSRREILELIKSKNNF